MLAAFVDYLHVRSKSSQLFENLNDADIISIPMFAACNVKMERNILSMGKLVVERHL